MKRSIRDHCTAHGIAVPAQHLIGKLIAHHEAGHFVVARYYDRYPLQLSIRSHDGVAGCVVADELRPEEPSVANVEGRIVGLYAGHAAACHLDLSIARWSRLTAVDDYQEAERLLHLLDDSTARYRLRHRAHDLVRDRWVGISAVAGELERNGELSGDEADIVMDIADGKCQPHILDDYRQLRDFT